jgi:hypothetical protein
MRILGFQVHPHRLEVNGTQMMSDFAACKLQRFNLANTLIDLM